MKGRYDEEPGRLMGAVRYGADTTKTVTELPTLSPQERERVAQAISTARAEAYQRGYRDASRKLLSIAGGADARVKRILAGVAHTH